MKKELSVCGSTTGKVTDKIKECGLKIGKGATQNVSIIEDCDIFYECEIIHKNKVNKETLDEEIGRKYYPKSDHHVIYFGRIIKSYVKQ